MIPHLRIAFKSFYSTTFGSLCSKFPLRIFPCKLIAFTAVLVAICFRCVFIEMLTNRLFRQNTSKYHNSSPRVLSWKTDNGSKNTSKYQEGGPKLTQFGRHEGSRESTKAGLYYRI